MLKRGRPSKQDLAIRESFVPVRPNPPSELTEVEKIEWDAVVNQMPADWFSREHFGLLKAYVRHVCRSDALSKLIEEFDATLIDDKDGMKAFGALLHEARAEDKCASDMAYRLQLSRSARYHPTTAARAVANNAVNRPWDEKDIAA